MSYGDSWRNFRGEYWRASPTTYFNAPSSNYSYQPYEHRPLNYGPRRDHDLYTQQRAHHGYTVPYMMPPQYYRSQEPENIFITPNAGMVENSKFCKSDEIPDDSRRRFEDFEDFGRSDETIITEVKCSSNVCSIHWSLSSKFSSVRYYIRVELYSNGNIVDTLKRDVRSSPCQFQTLPGYEYEYEVRLIHCMDNKTRLATGLLPFKAIFSMSEINELYNLAVKFTGKEALQQFKYLYRVKPEVYWQDIEARTHSVMEKYVKDANGHRASPINGEIRGLFFSGELWNGHFPPKSPFGDRRFFINADRLIPPDKISLYFADFYCNRKPHYVSIICCVKGSKTDLFCKKHIKQLNFYENPYLRVEACSGGEGIKYKYYVNDRVHVEICYTEDVYLRDGCFESVIPVGIGSSKVGGLRNNTACDICNLKKKDALLAITPTQQKPDLPQIVERSPSPEPPCSEHPFSTLSDNTNKSEQIPLKKQTPLQKLLANTSDRVKYEEPNFEVAKLVNDLIECVGMKVDLQNFQQKIKNAILDKSLKSVLLESNTIGSLLYRMP